MDNGSCSPAPDNADCAGNCLDGYEDINGICVAINGCDDITGLFISDIIDDRVVANYDNMNTEICIVDQIRIRYREVGTDSWFYKNIAAPVGQDQDGNCTSTSTTQKLILGLTLSTTYEWDVKIWYCGDISGGAWTPGVDFTTLDECPNVGNFSAEGTAYQKATFSWDDSNGPYEFVRIKMRVDALGVTELPSWTQVGGFGVFYGIFSKIKYNMTPGETYRAQARTLV